MSPRPRRHAHRGSVLAAGFVVEPAVVGEAAARARVLALWAPGCEVRAVDGAWLVRLPAPRRVAVVDAPGAPLVAQHGALASLPLAAAEVTALGPRTTIVARGGVLTAIDAAQGEPIDPASWLDVGALEVIAVAPLAAPPPVLIVPAAPTSDLRAAAGLGAIDRDATALRAAIAGGPSLASARRASWWSRFRRRAATATATATDTATATATATATDTATATATDTATATGSDTDTDTDSVALTVRAPGPWWARAVARVLGRPRQPSTLPASRSWIDRLRGRASVAIWQSALGRVLGRRHADYLRETLALFDRGELDAALRRAFPLDRAGAAVSQLALGLPPPRTALTPSLRRPGLGPALPLSTDAATLLRERYLAARDRLLREERVEEAAFVIADLLDDPDAAVTMLERRGRHRLAAELAEARGLAPGLVIRQWFLAGELERAVAVAWRTGAFADAIARAGREPVADRLRLAWAAACARAGDYLGAVDVIATLDDAARADGPAVERWIELGLAGGGVAAARLWIRRLVRDPARFDEVRAAIAPILAGDDDDALVQRVAIGRELLAAPHGPHTAALARAAARATLADVGRGVDGDPATLLSRLVRIAADPTLRADLPPLGKLPRRRALVDQPAPALHHWAASDAGALAVHDAVQLPGGRLLVALGELGVRLLTADGRTIAAWDQPADALAVSDHGAHAIAIARRGRSQRLARIDLARRTAEPWCDAELGAWAPTFDGGLWLVSRDRDLLAVDATAAALTVRWGVSDPGTHAWRGLTRNGEAWGAVHGEPGDAEAWIYQRFTLRHRLTIAGAADDVPVATAIRPEGAVWVRAVYQLGADAAPAPVLIGPGWREPLAALAGARLTGLTAAGWFAAVIAHRPAGCVVEVVYLQSRRTVARCLLDGATRVSARFGDLALALGDDRGRALVLDLRSGGLRSDLRLR